MFIPFYTQYLELWGFSNASCCVGDFSVIRSAHERMLQEDYLIHKETLCTPSIVAALGFVLIAVRSKTIHGVLEDYINSNSINIK